MKKNKKIKDSKMSIALVPTKEISNDIFNPVGENVKSELKLIREFQQIVQSQLIKDLDYGIIPGTKKPTLLKPGAEKMAKLCKLSDAYEIIEKIENWEQGIFYYQVKCFLTHIPSSQLISEGLGSCNSKENKYRYRWVYEKDVPSELDKNKIPFKIIKAKSGGQYRMYRVDNDDIYSQVNTLLKMAKKRALVDATLSACRLSAIFEQDTEDFENTTSNELSESITSEKFWLEMRNLRIDNDKILQHCKDKHPDWKITHPEDINLLIDENLRKLYIELKPPESK
jgi:hypothetical protein